MTRTPFSRVSLIALTAVLAAAPQAVFAQDSETETEDNASGNQIIVTSQKIEQRALDVPITITATSGERIRALGVTDLDELSYYTPGLLIQEQSANNPGVVIRGITSDSGSAAARDFILAPSAQDILEALLPLYVRNTVYRALVETAAGEQGARRTAMKNATDNATEMLQLLKRTYNSARQAQITQEIAEIVGGASALQG